jgi:RNA polymerase sigma factor (TIGR02999 family)
MRAERASHTLQPTALVHEAWLRLIDQTRVEWQGRAHFLAVASQAMRRILCDHARAHKAQKRGGGAPGLALEDTMAVASGSAVDVLDLDEALTALASLDSRQASVVEMRFYGGCAVAEVAEALGVSEKTVKNDWRVARAWLRGRLAN